MARTRTWALVTNGVRARILRDVQNLDGEVPLERISRASSSRLRDFISDSAERNDSSDTSVRWPTKEPGSDPVLGDMEDFARETMEFLEIHHRAGDFSRLAVFAEPKMLGILRVQAPATLWASVFLELPINLVALPERELRARVLEHIHSKGGRGQR